MRSTLQILALLGLAATTAMAQVSAPFYPDNWNWTNATLYPFTFLSTGGAAIAPTNTTLVEGWINLVNWSAVPDWPVNTQDANGDLVFTGVNNNATNPSCNWSYDGFCNRTTDVMECPTPGVWGLTFDDGPTVNDSLLYDYLDSINQKASLFYIGIEVAQYPAAAKRACQEFSESNRFKINSGHHISIHTWSHHMMTTLTNYEVVAELKYTEMIIKEVCGITPKYFRPPLGDMDDRVRAIAMQLVRNHDQMTSIFKLRPQKPIIIYSHLPPYIQGYTPIIWDLDTNDWTNDWPTLPETGVTATQEDANFTIWTTESTYVNASHGHICLQHELNNFTMSEAIKNIPILKKVYNVMPVASCIGQSYPYLEDIQYPILQPNGSVALSANTSSSTSISTTSTGTILSGVSSTSATAKPSSLSSTGSRAGPSFLASAVFGGMSALVALMVTVA
ncbi:hypothetical protein BC937DRAFT_93894 [Endogone sp. FLAS-F59071]|nr:hypothetical protein BC937DRAFT_93894 [Endogone sp. FLAS-F59071]|eukprot:RUS20988.1 hypothetical protein BC937DRAFT_93894 [Endogone sp. FLAS-F59071]